MSSFPTPTLAGTDSALDRMLAFVQAIGLEVEEARIDEPTFLPGILIQKGRLLIDHARLLYPGDLLHEAGHLAVTAATERPALGGNVTDNQPEKEGDELAVLLWSYAACRALNLPPEVVFHPAGYKGQSQWLLTSFERGEYLGLPLLVWMGLATAEEFPRMRRWLRE